MLFRSGGGSGELPRTAGTGTLTFAATSGTKTVNTAGVTFDCPFTFNGVGGTFQLASALTSGSSRTCTLTNGTLDLASYTLTTGLFSSTNSNARTLAFGTGKISLAGSATATVWETSTVTNLTTSSNVYFTLIAGRLPPGIQLDPLGYIAGQPVNDVVYVGGIPAAVNRDVDYTFTIRATSTANTKNITDRTFSLTVTGNNPPELLTGEGSSPPVSLGRYLDGTVVDIQLEAVDPDSPDLTWKIIEGSLPPGVSLGSNTGMI